MITAALPLELISVCLVVAVLTLGVVALNIWQLVRYLTPCASFGVG